MQQIIRLGPKKKAPDYYETLCTIHPGGAPVTLSHADPLPSCLSAQGTPFSQRPSEGRGRFFLGKRWVTTSLPCSADAGRLMK